MLEINRKLGLYRIKDIHFPEASSNFNGCDAVNVYSCKDKIDGDGFICKEKLTSVLDLSDDLDTIYKKHLSKHCRCKIHKAEQNGIKCLLNQRYDEFCNIRKSFEQKMGFAEILGIERWTCQKIKKYGTLFVAEYNDELLSGIVFLQDGTTMKGLISASIRLEVDKEKTTLIGYANRMLWWEAIKYAKANGIKAFDFGGLWSEEEAENDEHKKGINRVKMEFGGEVVKRYEYYRINSPSLKMVFKLYGLAKKTYGTMPHLSPAEIHS